MCFGRPRAGVRRLLWQPRGNAIADHSALQCELPGSRPFSDTALQRLFCQRRCGCRNPLPSSRRPAQSTGRPDASDVRQHWWCGGPARAPGPSRHVGLGACPCTSHSGSGGPYSRDSASSRGSIRRRQRAVLATHLQHLAASLSP